MDFVLIVIVLNKKNFLSAQRESYITNYKLITTTHYAPYIYKRREASVNSELLM